jgi:hypothetical protein
MPFPAEGSVSGRERGRSSLVTLVWAGLTAVFKKVHTGGSVAHAAPLLHCQGTYPQAGVQGTASGNATGPAADCDGVVRSGRGGTEAVPCGGKDNEDASSPSSWGWRRGRLA